MTAAKWSTDSPNFITTSTACTLPTLLCTPSKNVINSSYRVARLTCMARQTDRIAASF